MKRLLTAFVLVLALVASAIAAPPQAVRVRVNDGDSSSLGSGTLVRSDLIVTNWHVVKDRKGEVTVRFPDRVEVVATVVKVDRTWDLAVLRIDSVTVVPIEFGEVPKRGDIVIVGGYGGLDAGYKESSGPVLGFYSPANNSIGDIIRVGAQVRSGDSGSGMYKDGKLVGVLFGRQSDGTYGSHIGRVRWFLEDAE